MVTNVKIYIRIRGQNRSWIQIIISTQEKKIY